MTLFTFGSEGSFASGFVRCSASFLPLRLVALCAVLPAEERLNNLPGAVKLVIDDYVNI